MPVLGSFRTEKEMSLLISISKVRREWPLCGQLDPPTGQLPLCCPSLKILEFLARIVNKQTFLPGEDPNKNHCCKGDCLILLYVHHWVVRTKIPL